eukprot:CAMPEP_0182436854 /NCGR_PEP_ID=MMETSP1167-20130531/84037_1 /TAXON_ID=2988 /ORGANISM="Mallomonas Sp, Strain CCMP3275" /LENGTH=99 /DNA_ID=CAMNT_0024629477 /DNA_START=6 /DNA_END=302 /DNA_ORIENTATION=+
MTPWTPNQRPNGEFYTTIPEDCAQSLSLYLAEVKSCASTRIRINSKLNNKDQDDEDNEYENERNNQYSMADSETILSLNRVWTLVEAKAQLGVFSALRF